MQIKLSSKKLGSIPGLQATKSVSNPICHLKFQTADGKKVWYVREMETGIKGDTILFFGYVGGADWPVLEMVYFSPNQIENEGGELVLNFKPQSIKKITRLRRQRTAS